MDWADILLNFEVEPDFTLVVRKALGVCFKVKSKSDLFQNKQSACSMAKWDNFKLVTKSPHKLQRKNSHSMMVK